MSRTLRPQIDADTDALIALWLESTISGQAFLPEQHWRSEEPSIRSLMPSADVTVVEAHGEIVAFIALLGDLVGGLFTHPDHQGAGHGTALIEHARESHDPLYVEVFAANTAARQFYESRGFKDHERSVDEETGLELLILRLG